jgi:NitT/TauT family transport system permease protein
VVGLASIEPEKIYLARSMGFGATATFFKIRLPNALPAIFGGLKISITLAVVGAVVGEFVGGDAGLGYLLLVANGSMDTSLLFAGIVALTVLGVVLFLLVELAERLAIPRHIISGDKGARGTF